jgi:hypothetical protein
MSNRGASTLVTVSYHTVTLSMPSNANLMRTAPVSEKNFVDPVDRRDQNPMEVSSRVMGNAARQVV